jgi:hypothetical protein
MYLLPNLRHLLLFFEELKIVYWSINTCFLVFRAFINYFCIFFTVNLIILFFINLFFVVVLNIFNYFFILFNFFDAKGSSIWPFCIMIYKYWGCLLRNLNMFCLIILRSRIMNRKLSSILRLLNRYSLISNNILMLISVKLLFIFIILIILLIFLNFLIVI